VSARHPILARSAYLAATTSAMLGWVWLLFEGLEWALGV
jgi:hypothetical protein